MGIVFCPFLFSHGAKSANTTLYETKALLSSLFALFVGFLGDFDGKTTAPNSLGEDIILPFLWNVKDLDWRILSSPTRYADRSTFFTQKERILRCALRVKTKGTFDWMRLSSRASADDIAVDVILHFGGDFR
ncbi:MAG: hypothetical protein IJD35_03460 [Clostridia bacterium]|nr:hypothetical protein [Clostridia bacterium]